MVIINKNRQMKTIHNILIFAVAMLMYASCTPDKYSLGDIDVSPEELKEGIAYTIEHDEDNPNIVHLKSLMDAKYQPLWNHPQGRSQKKEVTLNMPFAGTYDVQFGVQTRGGHIYGDASQFVIDDLYSGFIEDELWTLLSGGAGNSKTWYLDLDENSTSRYFVGPVYYYGTDNGWLGDCYGEDCWSWFPDYPGNTWLMEAVNYGSMTFDLIGGANVTVENLAFGENSGKGTYMLDPENHTLRLTDVGILHNPGFDGIVLDWGEVKIFNLTKDILQLGVLRDPILSGESACYLVYNFISKDYHDNYVPEDKVEEITLPNGWQDDIASYTTTTINWVLSPETPFNWASLTGESLNPDWTSPQAYPDWTGFNSSIPNSYSGFSLALDSEAKTVIYTAPDGTVQEGTYTLSEKGIYTFQGVKPSFNICSWVNFGTTEDNTWQITSIETNKNGDVSGMWVGAIAYHENGAPKEYMTYKLIPSVGGGSASSATELSIDSSKIILGNIEDNNDKFRIEIYNQYGDTGTDAPFQPANLKFDTSIEIRFSISGITLKSGAPTEYKTAIQLADADWSSQYWGDGTGSGEATITGDGTYTVKYTSTDGAFDGALVFCIDIVDLVPNLEDLSAVSVTIDKVIMN